MKIRSNLWTSKWSIKLYLLSHLGSDVTTGKVDQKQYYSQGEQGDKNTKIDNIDILDDKTDYNVEVLKNLFRNLNRFKV